ncbi:WhiB family transcriptional regulator [Streptomyces sp. NPDC059002]|uniref:WhiB family transcriptional regulator n=1 Tax=Streptomyces sp. NPDC059002 TaxID=3346690 RepID=UPI0036CC8BE4
MTPGIEAAVHAALSGDWAPLLEAASETPGKNWAENARCAGQRVEIFFPDAEEPWSDPDQVRRTQGIALNRPLNLCAACPLAVAARCLIESLRNDEEYGIRAGLLASERSELLSCWKRRVDDTAVSAALRGVTTLLTAREREEVVAQFVADPMLGATRVARGLGISSKYLWQLAREHRQRHTPAAAPSSVSVAKAA